MVYVIRFFTSDETIEQSFALESSKLTTEDLSKIRFVKNLKLLIGNDEYLPDSTYVLPVISSWKELVLIFLQEWTNFFPKLFVLIKLLSNLEEGKYLGISLNDSMEYLEKKRLLFEMQERENGIPAKKQYNIFLNKNGSLYEKYRPEAFSYDERIRFGTQDRTKRVRRYCGKKMPATTFKNASHTISKCLGNISFFTNDECDICNNKFGKTIETEFLKYVSIYRTLASQFEGHPYFTTINDTYKIEIDKETNKVVFQIIDKSKTVVNVSRHQTSIDADGGTINFHDVYRALVKFVVGMLPDKELPFFEETIKWVNGDENMRMLPVVKETIYKEPEPHPYVNLFFRITDSKDYPYLIADFHVNHLEFLYVIPGCKNDSIDIEENILDVILRLKNDKNEWRNLKMNCPQPQKMTLHASFYRK